MSHIVIIGTGHAGLSLAREIRLKDANCKLTLISKESICAYYKPNLSKALSTGKTAEQLIMKTAEKLTDEFNATCLSHTEVIDINSVDQTLNYQTKDSGALLKLAYDKLVLATGASPIRLPNTLSAPEHVLHINNLSDYQHFRTQLTGKKSVAIIGAGYIGCELASDLSSQDINVSVIDRGTWPLNRAVPESIGSVIQQEMTEKQKIDWYLGKTLARIDKANKQFKVSLESGEQLTIDLVLSAIGLQANTALAKLIGADTALGIKVDSLSQTSIPNVYALGDCAEYQDKLLPFIAPITQAAKALASTLCGEEKSLVFTANAVPVKISVCPTVICPSSESSGIWEVQGNGLDLEAYFLNEFGELTGFALTGNAVSKKIELLKRCKAMNFETHGKPPIKQQQYESIQLSNAS